MQAEGLGHQIVGAVVKATHARFHFLPVQSEPALVQNLIELANLVEHLLAIL